VHMKKKSAAELQAFKVRIDEQREELGKIKDQLRVLEQAISQL